MAEFISVFFDRTAIVFGVVLQTLSKCTGFLSTDHAKVSKNNEFGKSNTVCMLDLLSVCHFR